MIRLGYLVPEWPAQTHAFFWREVQALRSFGAEVTLFSTRRPPQDSCRHEFAASARASTRYLFPPRKRASLAVLTRSGRRMRDALAYLGSLHETPPKERAKLLALLPCAADLVSHAEALGITHVHVHSCANAAHLAHVAKLLGGPSYSLTLHGDLPVYGVDHAHKMARASFVAAVTRPLQAQILQVAKLPAERVPLIPMGVDTDLFTPASAKPARPGQLRMATIARLNPVKGHGYVLEALARLKRDGLDVHYTIAGEGPHREAIEAQVRTLSLGAEVTFAGTVSEGGVLEILRAADAFVLASEGMGEAAPVSVMEAMACGVPVICSRIGGTGDMIDDQVDGLLIAQRDVGALTTNLERLARDLPFRAQIAAAARERALTAFDYRAMARRLYDAVRHTSSV
jgi:colanic acid/amylovoran biosynthesis glycosyltransferase